MMKGKKGFTLIELLVVIAIIAILAAILFPVFLMAKAKANQAKCMSNLKQIGVAISLYMSDTDGRYPSWRSDPSDSVTGTGTWYRVMIKYSKAKPLGTCPADVSKPGTASRISYWKNVYLDYWSGAGGYNPSLTPITEAAVVSTKTTVFLMDGPFGGKGGHTWWGPPMTWNGTNSPDYGANYFKYAKEAEERHGGGANVLFCDWHVGVVRPNGWKSTRVNTGDTNPLKPLGCAIPPEWADKNDGSHPWFRAD